MVSFYDIEAIKNAFEGLKEGDSVVSLLSNDYYKQILRKESDTFETFTGNFAYSAFNAVIGWEGQSYQYGYKEGFFKIAHQSIENTIHSSDILVYPIIYNYRQYLELVLKENITRFEILFRLPMSDLRTHDLKTLLEILLNILEDKNLGFLISPTHEKVIKDFMEIDPKNDAFRFVYDFQGNFNHEYKHKLINLHDLHFTMNEVYNDFNAVDYLFESGGFFDDEYLTPLNEGLIVSLNNYFPRKKKNGNVKDLKELVSKFEYKFSDNVVFKLDVDSFKQEDENTYKVQSIPGFNQILVINIEAEKIKWIKVL